MREPSAASPRRRMSKQQRHTQLLHAARELIRESGTAEFTLARLAERAGVTKPLVYDHFGDRDGVLAELYRDFEARQRETLRAALDETEPDLPTVASLVAGAYIDCWLAEGRELADVVAALVGSASLNRLRQEAEDAYLDMCREVLAPLAGPIDAAGLRAIVGAGDALARSALDDHISAARARDTLAHVVTAVATENRHPRNEETP